MRRVSEQTRPLEATRVRALDPVCGMRVDVSSAVRREFDGRTHFFCSESCALAFERAPGDYDVPSTRG